MRPLYLLAALVFFGCSEESPSQQKPPACDKGCCLYPPEAADPNVIRCQAPGTTYTCREDPRGSSAPDAGVITNVELFGRQCLLALPPGVNVITACCNFSGQ
jgi:hypothetical protein